MWNISIWPILCWCDVKTNQTNNGKWHLNFKIKKKKSHMPFTNQERLCYSQFSGKKVQKVLTIVQKNLTGSLVSGELLTDFPNASSWNCSNCRTKLDKLLLVGGSACVYWNRYIHCWKSSVRKDYHLVYQSKMWYKKNYWKVIHKFNR
jgi:hypothetical protein